jgi:hypothetical protein
LQGVLVTAGWVRVGDQQQSRLPSGKRLSAPKLPGRAQATGVSWVPEAMSVGLLLGGIR